MIKSETAVFGGGCFWCTEAIFKSLKGVISVTPGYAGGTMKNPSYHEVGSGQSGHAEVIKIDFNPLTIPYADLLDIFWNTHNPTSRNQQGNDIGTQYRSIILYTTDKQKQLAVESVENLKKKGAYKNPIVTEIKPLDKFYHAEDYHKDYYTKNMGAPYCELVISPKLQHLREKYGHMLKE